MQTPSTDPNLSSSEEQITPAPSSVDPGYDGQSSRMIGQGAEPKEAKRQEKWRRRSIIILGLGGSAKLLTRCVTNEIRESKERRAREAAIRSYPTPDASSPYPGDDSELSDLEKEQLRLLEEYQRMQQLREKYGVPSHLDQGAM